MNMVTRNCHNYVSTKYLSTVTYNIHYSGSIFYLPKMLGGSIWRHCAG